MDVAGVHREGLGEILHVPQEDAAARVRRVQPLVWIERDRIRALDPGEERAKIVGEDRGATVGSVDVQPKIKLAGKIGEFGERVDRACGDGPGGRDDRERARARRYVGFDRAPDLRELHSELGICRDVSHGVGSQTQHVRRSIDNGVDLFRCVDRHLWRIRDTAGAYIEAGLGIARGLQTDEVGHRAARRKQPSRAVRQSELAGEPTREMQLDLGGRGRQAPAADVLIHRGRYQVAGNPWDGAGAGDVGHEPGVSWIHRMIEHDRAQVRHEVIERHWVIRHVERDGRAHFVGSFAAGDRQIGKPVEQLHPEVERAFTELARALRVPVEIAERLRAVHVGVKVNASRRRRAPR